MEAACRSQEPSWSPRWLSAVEAGKQYSSEGARNRRLLPRVREPGEAIRPNNLSRPPNCFLLLTKNHTAALACREISACYEALGNPFITEKCWLFVSTDPISVNQWTARLPPPASAWVLGPAKLRAGLPSSPGTQSAQAADQAGCGTEPWTRGSHREGSQPARKTLWCAGLEEPALRRQTWGLDLALPP